MIFMENSENIELLKSFYNIYEIIKSFPLNVINMNDQMIDLYDLYCSTRYIQDNEKRNMSKEQFNRKLFPPSFIYEEYKGELINYIALRNE